MCEVRACGRGGQWEVSGSRGEQTPQSHQAARTPTQSSRATEGSWAQRSAWTWDLVGEGPRGHTEQASARKYSEAFTQNGRQTGRQIPRPEALSNSGFAESRGGEVGTQDKPEESPSVLTQAHLHERLWLSSRVSRVGRFHAPVTVCRSRGFLTCAAWAAAMLPVPTLSELLWGGLPLTPPCHFQTVMTGYPPDLDRVDGGVFSPSKSSSESSPATPAFPVSPQTPYGEKEAELAPRVPGLPSGRTLGQPPALLSFPVTTPPHHPAFSLPGPQTGSAGSLCRAARGKQSTSSPGSCAPSRPRE